MPNAPMPTERGLIRGPLILLLLMVIAAGAGWYWFVGRFRVPEQAPDRPGSVTSVLDYEGRRDLGTDPLDAMARPGIAGAAEGGAEARLQWGKWSAAYAKAAVARARWKAADAAAALTGGAADEALLIDYLHEAQVAEYWRARYRNSLEE